MADLYTGLFTGRAGSEAIIRNAIADELITVGSPVIIVAAPAGERDARVEPAAVQGGAAVGVVVDGDNKGGYGETDENAAAVAGETVKLVTKGRCKVRVKGDVTPVAIGSPLTMAATDGLAEVALAADNVFARALQAATGASDFILCDVDIEGVL